MASNLVDNKCTRCNNALACPVGDSVFFRVHDIKQDKGSWNLTGQCKFCNELVTIGRLFPVIDTNPVPNEEDEQDIVDTEAEHSYTES